MSVGRALRRSLLVIVTILVAAGAVVTQAASDPATGRSTSGVGVTSADQPHSNPAPASPSGSIPAELFRNIRHNLFKPLLLFFYLGFLIPVLRVEFEFPYPVYQGLTIYLLIAIGWRGGEELAQLGAATLGNAVGFMAVGFLTNTIIGVVAYFALGRMTSLRRIDRATVAGYYGSDSAGTFVTCLGVLTTARIAYAAYMPVMLAVMEIPGCLVALAIVARLRASGMDPAGTMPDEPGFDRNAPAPVASKTHESASSPQAQDSVASEESQEDRAEAIEEQLALSLEKRESVTRRKRRNGVMISPKLLHEVFLNPGLVLLFGGIAIGYISGLQGEEVTRADDNFFVNLFQGMLCLFLLEMGMTAARKLRDLRDAGAGFIAFGLLAPNVFATVGMLVAHAYSYATGVHLDLGTYVLFAVLCGAASYIAVPAVQRMAIPEASPTLPLAASLGLTFTYNVTLGIPIYLEIAKYLTTHFGVA